MHLNVGSTVVTFPEPALHDEAVLEELAGERNRILLVRQREEHIPGAVAELLVEANEEPVAVSLTSGMDRRSAWPMA